MFAHSWSIFKHWKTNFLSLRSHVISSNSYSRFFPVRNFRIESREYRLLIIFWNDATGPKMRLKNLLHITSFCLGYPFKIHFINMNIGDKFSHFHIYRAKMCVECSTYDRHSKTLGKSKYDAARNIILAQFIWEKNFFSILSTCLIWLTDTFNCKF